MPGQSRFTLPTSQYPELSNQRFATFLESTNGVRSSRSALSTGARGTSVDTAPPERRSPARSARPARRQDRTIVSVSPSAGPSQGGTDITITGTNFAAGATVKVGTTTATQVRVLNATTILASDAAERHRRRHFGVGHQQRVTVSLPVGVHVFVVATDHHRR